jgi:hypothetical protein
MHNNVPEHSMRERYLRNERLCREQADASARRPDKQAWLDMADQWAEMARGCRVVQQQQQVQPISNELHP